MTIATPARSPRWSAPNPAMAARLLQVANSAALNPNGNRITELKSAIARIGFSNVRTVSLAYAMDQIKNAPALQPIRKPLNDLWERSVKVAAMAYVVARRWTKVNADQALLAGLMHGMGRVYILTRAVNHPALFSDAESYQQIVRDWNTSHRQGRAGELGDCAGNRRCGGAFRGHRTRRFRHARPYRCADHCGCAGVIPRRSGSAGNSPAAGHRERAAGPQPPTSAGRHCRRQRANLPVCDRRWALSTISAGSPCRLDTFPARPGQSATHGRGPRSGAAGKVAQLVRARHS